MHNPAFRQVPNWSEFPQPREIIARLCNSEFYTNFAGDLRPLTERAHRAVVRLEVLRRQYLRNANPDITALLVPTVQDTLREAFAVRCEGMAA